MLKVHRVLLGPFETNGLILEDGETGEALLVDGGMDPDAMESRVRALQVRPVMLVHTHAHVDHCMASPELARRLGIPTVLHPADLPLWRNVPIQVQALLGPEVVRSLGISGDPPDPDRLVQEGDRLAFGGLEAEVIHLPGHSPGGIGLFLRQGPGVLVSGDTLFRDGVGRTDLWGGDWGTLVATLHQKVFTLPPETVVWPGHGASTTVGREQAGFLAGFPDP
ncbi:MAG TPA: MBL fold metallo-hydrolase [Myxococcota bacterium]|nr:MBL fold metallo-hydrolase [Myxococcota bacterium]HQK52124.1 MBL fold metallo-hydrolase [Myxococcota bacterium]